MKSEATRSPRDESLFAACACGAAYFRPNGHECNAPEPQVFDLVGYLTTKESR